MCVMVYWVFLQCPPQIGGSKWPRLSPHSSWFIIIGCIQGPHELDGNEMPFSWLYSLDCVFARNLNIWHHIKSNLTLCEWPLDELGEFHVGPLPTRFLRILGRRCSHVVKPKPPSNHMLAVCQNVEGRRHSPWDFHAPTKESWAYKCQSPHDLDMLKSQENQWQSTTPSLVTGRKLVGMPRFEKMGVVSLAHTNATPLDSFYIWPSFFVFALEFGGRVAYIETDH